MRDPWEFPRVSEVTGHLVCDLSPKCLPETPHFPVGSSTVSSWGLLIKTQNGAFHRSPRSSFLYEAHLYGSWFKNHVQIKLMLI